MSARGGAPEGFTVQPGTLLAGKYQVTGTLGRGGMGVVVSATHTVLKRPVALKFLLPGASQTTVERFLREAQSAASLQSEHVARVSDTGTLENGSPYIVMEFLQGKDLAQLLEERGVIRLPDAVDYILQTLEAIAEAHSRGIVHRDLKPSNLFIAMRSDGSSVVKVLDFGLAKADMTEGRKLTQKDTILGTPYYISPEQFRSSSTVDSRSDLWSLGVILYEMLSGKRPFTGRSPGEVLTAIFEGIPRSVRERRPDVPAEVEAIVRKLLTRDVNERFQSAGELAQALAPFGSGAWNTAVSRAVALQTKPVVTTLMVTPRDNEAIRVAAPSQPQIAERFGPAPTSAPSGLLVGIVAMVVTLILGLALVAAILALRLRS